MQNGFTAVNLYLDEIGALKKLPTNSRGAALAAACGFVDVPFYGDLYIGRVQSRQNLDFSLTEMDSGAAWMKGVRAQPDTNGPVLLGTTRAPCLTSRPLCCSRQAVASNLEHSQQMSAFNAQMESSGGGGMMQVNTEEGPTRTEDDGTKGYSWEQSDEVIPRNDPPQLFIFAAQGPLVTVFGLWCRMWTWRWRCRRG